MVDGQHPIPVPAEGSGDHGVTVAVFTTTTTVDGVVSNHFNISNVLVATIVIELKLRPASERAAVFVLLVSNSNPTSTPDGALQVAYRARPAFQNC